MTGLLHVAGCLIVFAVGQTAPAEDKVDYEPLSRLIREMVVKKAPTYVEDLSEWNKSAPPPPRLLQERQRPILGKVLGPRTTIKVGDRVEFAHGAWKKARIWMTNPDQDLTLRVTELKPADKGKYHLALTSTAAIHGEGHWQQWLNGLMLANVTGRAKAVVRADLEFDVALALDVSKFPPAVSIDPKLTKNQITFDEFTLFDPTRSDIGVEPKLLRDRIDLKGLVNFDSQKSAQLNADLKGLLTDLMRGKEPVIREEANKMIAEALRDKRGGISPAALLEAIRQGKK